MLAQVRGVRAEERRYAMLMVWCPGCESFGEDWGLHGLPIEGSGDVGERAAWGWNGNLVAVTLTPSILTRSAWHDGDVEHKYVCHSFLTDGVWNYLGDCTHIMVNQAVPMVPLPDWVIKDE